MSKITKHPFREDLNVIQLFPGPKPTRHWWQGKYPPFFAKRKGGGFDYWAVESTGDYGSDCNRGSALAYEFLDFLIAQGPTVGNPYFLSEVVGSMIEKNCPDGLRVGFMRAVGQSLMTSVCDWPELVARARALDAEKQSCMERRLEDEGRHDN